jgi:hypothetical protein
MIFVECEAVHSENCVDNHVPAFEGMQFKKKCTDFCEEPLASIMRAENCIAYKQDKVAEAQMEEPNSRDSKQ